MTRFDAATPDERRKLFVEAIRAHRERSSPFLTVETGPPGAAADDGGGEEFATDADRDLEGIGDSDAPFGGSEGDDGDATAAPIWVQFGNGVVNLDATEEELDRVKDLVGRYPAFRIDELARPEEAEGVNVRVSARADANRIAEFLDDLFLSVYDRPEDYRAWVVEV